MKSILLKIFGGPVVHGNRTLSSWKLGAAFVVFALAFGWACFNKVEIRQAFTPSETIKVHFAQNQVISPYYSKVKVNWVPAGLVTGLEKLDDGSAMVTVEVDDGIAEKLGSAPTAVLRPTTLLGGYYFVNLTPGGNPGKFEGTIPRERTELPVELGQLLRSFQPNAQVGLRGFLGKFDQTLAGGGREALQRLVSDAPASLKPTGEVLDALRGTNPNKDLTDFVTGFEATSRALTDKPGQLSAVARDLAVTSRSFGNQSVAFANTISQLPSALTSADTGLIRLNVTLDILKETADDIRPSAKELGDTLDHLDPVLKDARPVVHELREVFDDARPLIKDLVPVVKDATDVFDDLSGDVLDRVNHPIKDTILGDFHGTGPYAQTQTDKPIFQELGYMVNNLDRATLMDRNGGAIAFEPSGNPQLVENLIQNNGQGRAETVPRILTDPARQSPPLELPRPVQPPHPGSDNLGSGQQLLGGLLKKEGGR